ncbi:serine-threonine protein kinase, putative [Entamoeba invadens IP1]|uniref:Serine-threonine protein kinase, putative n=1 Tax=Entamoeba invadens IP1 TaxID=370355 RepID=A0A0A1UC91_ENTIV|nr:serine-threonine protein kinase, putative [Entamoeba invadens IP1]ELP92758.1 serine-threonine protein kinase, putative [Entamoeba invadens IP1]|eukprot:XP_004259529.1 serine-threonine protein kinase, putative [Entamoeba invadens IP1]
MLVCVVLTSLFFVFLISPSRGLEGCKTMFSENRCIECEDNYTLYVSPNPISGGVPYILCRENGIITNCKEKTSSICIECDQGYYLKDNYCNECNENCLSCNDQVCYTCKEGTFLTLDQKGCTNCLGENASQCGFCSDGSYFDTTLKICKSCSANCDLCTDSTNCFQCKNNYYLVNTSNCVAIENCLSDYTKSDHCEKCKEGYRLQAGGCVECTLKNCSECYIDPENNERCFRCQTDFVPSNGYCKSLSDVNCLVGSVVYGCQRCSNGYYLNNVLECVSCDVSCGTCINQATNCLTCSEDYYFKNGGSVDNVQCVLVNKETCKKHDQSGCKECNNDLTTVGYYVPPDGQECEKCAENCTLCEGAFDHCTACSENYILKSVGSFYSCVLKDESCVKASMGYCIQCSESYFIGQNMGCIRCEECCGSCEASDSCLTCAPEYYKGSNGSFCSPYSLINMTCTPTVTGCAGNCLLGYYAENSTQINCTACPPELGCAKCGYNENKKEPECLLCDDNEHYIKNGKCVECKTLENCIKCNMKSGCEVCADGFKTDNESKCVKNNLGVIVGVVVTVVVLIVIILIIFIILISWKMIHKNSATKNIKPFKVTSELELSLLAADNKNFPLKTKTWELNFGLNRAKALVDKEYTESIEIANTTKKSYFFEILATPSHRYNLEMNPPRYSLHPGEAITIEFKIKMLCTSCVTDDIGIIAMDIDDQNKETAKMSLIIESDLSLKLDHTDLAPQLPAIGEGAFGMVFRGTYRGRDVAIKKMKSRNMTQEQEKEFNHEVSMLTQLRHQCVVEFIGAVYTEGEISIVTEFAEFGSLSKMWNNHSASYSLKVKILDDLAVALQFLHQNQILHRDVKGENVLIYSLNPHSAVCGKLTDFGTCRNISDRNKMNKELTQGIGTPMYMSPECLQNEDYGYPIDVYAFSIVMYETYTEKGAYTDEKIFDQPWKIPQFVIEGNRLPRPTGMNDNYWELMTSCWNQVPDKRPSFTDILKTIEGWNEDIKYALLVEGIRVEKEIKKAADEATDDKNFESKKREKVEFDDNGDMKENEETTSEQLLDTSNQSKDEKKDNESGLSTDPVI